MRTRSPGQRAGLSHAQVVAAARQLLAERGIEGVTMRAVADLLDVRANALYSHVESKAALLDDILDDALAAVEAPEPNTPDAIAGVQALMSSTYQVLLQHSDLIPLYLARQGARGPNAHRLGDIILELLPRSGVNGPNARAALHVLIVYAIGSAAFATRSPLPSDDHESSQAEDHAGHFERGLEWLLAGISREPTSAHGHDRR